MEEAVADAGGSIIHHAIIEDIRYEAALIDLPGSEIERLVAREEIHLAICDDVMFLRPQSSLDVPERGDETESGAALAAEPPDDRPPIAALLDGIPVQNHQLLDGRLDVDDPDNLEAMSVLSERQHGTAMASLILHGDRNLGEPPISRRLHVRPVMYAPGNGDDEAPRRDRLLVDVIYRAIRRMKEGDGEGEATAPEVFLVNLSLGDPRRPLSGLMSPWAKLLDHLAEHYGILFLVSAGNVKSPLPVSTFADWMSFENADSEERERAVLQALADNGAYRTLLSPAEALNVVTVRAWHDDALDGSRGASAATALATRAAHRIFDALMDTDGGSLHGDLDPVLRGRHQGDARSSSKMGEPGGRPGATLRSPRARTACRTARQHRASSGVRVSRHQGSAGVYAPPGDAARIRDDLGEGGEGSPDTASPGPERDYRAEESDGDGRMVVAGELEALTGGCTGG